MTASEYRQLLTDTLNRLDMAAVDAMVECFADAHARGATIFTMGNGGSGASASHAAGDFLKGASYGLDQRFKMICLNDNLPSMMAIANDIGWDDIFVEPLKNFLQPGDVVIGISGSGNSKNVLKAVDYIMKSISGKPCGSRLKRRVKRIAANPSGKRRPWRSSWPPKQADASSIVACKCSVALV